MELSEAREFVGKNHRAVLATRTPVGGVQQSPVLVGVDAEGRFLVSSRETAYKTRNLRADPWAQFCVLPDSFFGSWVFVEGEAEVLSLPAATEPLVEYYREVSGEHDDWDAYRESLREQRRVLLRVTAFRAGPDRSG